MFVGHFGVALAAKRVAPRTSLATLVAAASFLDLVWPVFLLAGAERVRVVQDAPTPFLRLDFESYPGSHSALFAALWAAVFALAYLRTTGYRTGALTCGALVFSHWVLDLATHRPDLPLWPGGPKAGLGLWYSTAGTLVVELAIFMAGIAVYAGSTRPRNAVGRWGLAGFVLLLLLAYVSSLGGPPPPSVTAIAVVSLLGAALAIALAAWVDRNRDVRSEAAPIPRVA